MLIAEQQELNAIEISYSESGDQYHADESSENGEVLTHYFNASNSSAIDLKKAEMSNDKGGMA